MEKIVKEFYIYDFEELGEDIKEKVIARERDTQRELYCDLDLNDNMGSKASDLLNDYFGITSDYLNTYYDLSYSQGSGAMVEFDIDIVDLNNKYNIFTSEEIRFMVDYELHDSIIKVRHNNNHYYHEYTFNVYFRGGYDTEYICDLFLEEIKQKYDISKINFDTIETRLEELLIDSDKHYTKSPFIKDIISINKELARYGYDSIEYWWNCEDNEIVDIIKANEYKYLESGEMY